jgi:23S rRNA (uracil1939-C5)-methyltransferase
MALKIGDRVRTHIGDVAFGGDGVGRSGELVVFVPFTVDGDETEVEITEIRKRYARGRLVGVAAPSPHRVEAPCPYYTRCGGCRMQHIAYGRQLELKRRQIAEAMGRIAKLSAPPVAPVIPSSRPYGWRSKAEFHLAGFRGEPRRVGLMALASHELVEVERCGIVDKSINRKYGEFRQALGAGAVRVPGEDLVIWSDEPGQGPTPIASGSGKPPDVTRFVGGKRFTVPYRGFFQANGVLIGELVEQVVAMSALTGRETVVDAYGGTGLFSLFLAPGAGRLVGIEGDREAVRCAGINLDREGLAQVQFIHGDVADTLEKAFIRRFETADVVVLDPPRDGCIEGTAERVAALRPKRIVYVSCNPTTLARDIRRLSDCGYHPVRLQPLDMFPQTAHVEVVALLMPDLSRDQGGERG